MNALSNIETLIASPNVNVSIWQFALALILSVVVALVVSLLYYVFYEDRATGARIHRSFLLISPSITALFIAIQFSLPLSLGLVGALTIIRFRTPIKEPEEVAFIMLIIAASIVCATFQYLLLAALLVVATAALLMQKYVPVLFGAKRSDGTLLLAFEGQIASSISERITRTLEGRLKKCRIESMAYGENLTTMHFSFSGLKPSDLDGLSEEIGRLAPVKKLNVFYNRRGVLA